MYDSFHLDAVLYNSCFIHLHSALSMTDLKYFPLGFLYADPVGQTALEKS